MRRLPFDLGLRHLQGQPASGHLAIRLVVRILRMHGQ
jgi:hypothetical protein